MTDAVWLVGGPAHEDRANLRYSLRSVEQHLPWIDQVWIAGDIPAWVSDNARQIPLQPLSEKFANMRQSLTAALDHPDTADELLVLNDDHFVMRPLDRATFPVHHLGDTAQFTASLVAQGKCSRRNTWLRAIQATSEWVAQHGHWPGCYDSHTPLLFDKTLLAQTLADYPADRPLAYPELYPIAGTGGPGVKGLNVKVVTEQEHHDKTALNPPFLSSTDASMTTTHPLGQLIRDSFPDPGKHETSKTR